MQKEISKHKTIQATIDAAVEKLVELAALMAYLDKEHIYNEGESLRYELKILRKYERV